MFRLIDNWRMIWWRRWSTWLAALNSFCVTYLFSQPVILLGLLGFVPSLFWQIVLAATFGTLAFVLPVLVTLLKQPKLEEKIQEKTDADAIANSPTT